MDAVASAEEMMRCQYSCWYPDFENVCYRTRLVPLPPEFVNYLVSDFVFGESNQANNTDEESFSNDGESSSTSDSQSICNPSVAFPDVMAEIEQALEELGGQVVPKLNWSAPTDAVWLLPNQHLKCTSASEVVMILKSSDRIAHDICHAFDHCPDTPAPHVEYVLALRKWQNLRPESEFRCFVRDNELVGISQREVTQYFPQLVGCEDKIESLLDDFFEQHVRMKFPISNCELFTPQNIFLDSFDIYITSKNRVRLLDFNPIGGATSPLLFTWAELKYVAPSEDEGSADDQQESNTNGEIAGSGGLVRIVKNTVGLMLGSKMAYAMPYDLVGCSVKDMVSEIQKLEQQ